MLSPCSFPRLVSPYTSSVDTLMKRLMVPVMRAASSMTCVPKMLFMVKEKLLPKLLSTCVCADTQHVNSRPVVCQRQTPGQLLLLEWVWLCAHVLQVQCVGLKSGCTSAGCLTCCRPLRSRTAQPPPQPCRAHTCAAKCMIVSICSACRTKLSRSMDWMSPLTSCGARHVTTGWPAQGGLLVSPLLWCNLKDEGQLHTPREPWAGLQTPSNPCCTFDSSGPAAHLDIGLVNHALQVVDAGAVVQLVQHNNLQAGTTQQIVKPAALRAAVAVEVGPTLYCGYRFASLITTCDAMKPQPPVILYQSGRSSSSSRRSRSRWAKVVGCQLLSLRARERHAAAGGSGGCPGCQHSNRGMLT